MDSMTRARNGANANVYLPLLGGAPLESALHLARERADHAAAPTIPARKPKRSVGARGMRPNAKELRAARRVVGDVEAHYVALGLATRDGDAYTLTRLGALALACARLVEGAMGNRQPGFFRCFQPLLGHTLVTLEREGLASHGRASGWTLTEKGRALVVALGLAPKGAQ